jgi:phosphoribosylanthranilate isomerase
MTLVKICGVTRAEDAVAAADAGADMVGVILWEPSPRAATPAQAGAVRDALGDRCELVGVFVDEDPERIDELAAELGLDRIQLHGAESRETILRFGPKAIRAVRDGDVSGVPEGVAVLYDRAMGEARDVETLHAHWRAAEPVARVRTLLLAGRLDAGNVADAVAAVRPFGVDVASGVERAPGIKDHEQVRRFVAAAKEAQ